MRFVFQFQLSILHVNVVLCSCPVGRKMALFQRVTVVSQLPEVICEMRRQEFGSM